MSSGHSSPSKMQPNYFVCTLGQAAALNSQPKPYRTINDFIIHQAQSFPSLPAVAFPIPRPDREDWGYTILTFGDVNRGINVFAGRLIDKLGMPAKSTTVALLCHSSMEFLFTWLGLIKLGHSVLLIAPQCPTAAILHLCRSCEAHALFYDTAHEERAHHTENLAKEEGLTSFNIQPVPLGKGENISAVIQKSCNEGIHAPQVEETAIAYLHHTSGTSSGLPKPIPQSHRAAIGVLPNIQETPTVATFTTTPLYHGGIADLFRCWTSNAMIWLFPGKDVPITARNICRCLELAKSYSDERGSGAVKYFSSVPYILQMMEADIEGLVHLQRMSIVGVGGAALPAEVGDRLVKKGVNLISRFGSAECGFVLSSYREFSADNAWQYLRNENPSGMLEFKQHDDDLRELIIRPEWPHMAKQSCVDGSFATADLFAPHPVIEDAWLYHSRADSQLTLVTGKKFDPAPLEDAMATSPYVDDVLIFGNHRPFSGALLLRSAEFSRISDEELLDVIRPSVEKLNSESQNHARIPFDMLIPLPHQNVPLEKSSKGTINRRIVEARFAEVIERAYHSPEEDYSAQVQDEDVSRHLACLIQSITSQTADLAEDVDLFSYGVDSIACIQLRTRLTQLIPCSRDEIPISIIEDCGTIQRLTEYILRKRHGRPGMNREDEEKLMLRLVEQFGAFEPVSRGSMTNGLNGEANSGAIVVLTGATGALGAHILDLLQKTASVATIFCLVRGADEQAARARVSKALQQRGLINSKQAGKLSEKIRVIPAQLSNQRLGLSDELYDCLTKEATSIIHVAWTVNFRLRLRSFVKDNIIGLRNLLDLAIKVPRHDPPRFTYCSSTAAIMNAPFYQSECLPEGIWPGPSSASPLGYSRSKWVAEQICLQAHERTSLGGRINVVRVGQLAGDSKSGIWNSKEAWPMMLSTAKLIHCLPDLKDEPLDWLPVDVAAQALVEITQVESESKGKMRVYHVLNPHQSPTWGDLLQWLQEKRKFQVVSPDEWIRRLECLENVNHSAMKLLGLWKESYGKAVQEPIRRRKFSIAETSQVVPAMKDVKPVEEGYIQKIWDWVQEKVD